MPGQTIGEVSVKVRPDTTGFAKELKAKLEALNDDFKVNVGLETKKASAEFKALKERIEHDTIQAKVDLDKTATSKFQQALSKLTDGASNAGSGFSNASNGMTRFGSSVLRVSALTAALIPLIVAVAGAIMAVAGAAAAGLAGLPVVLGAIAAPAAAVWLGFDGIKKAAERLTPQVESLKKALSGTFQSGMIPVFDKLKAVFPPLQAGLKNVAGSVIELADALATMVTGPDWVGPFGRLQVILDGAATAVRAMTPGVVNLINSLGAIAAIGPMYQLFGETISGVATRFSDFLDRVRETGLLQSSLVGLRDVLFSVTDLFSSFANAAMEFFNSAAPGITKFFTGFADLFEKIDWATLGKSFGDTFGKLGEYLSNIPQGALDKLVQTFVNFGLAIQEFIAFGGIDLIIASLGLLIGTFNFLMSVINIVVASFMGMHAIIAAIPGWWDSIWSGVGSFFSSVWAGIVSVVSSAGSAVVGFVVSMASSAWSAISSAWNSVVSFTTSAWSRMVSAVSNGVNNAVNFVRGLPGRVVGALGNLGGLLVASGRSLIQGFINGIKGMIGAAVGAARSVVSSVRNLFPFSPAKVGPFSGKGYTTHSGKALMTDWAAGIEAAAPAAIRAVENTANKMQGAMNGNFGGTISAEGYGNITGDLALAMSGMAFTIDEDGGKVLAKVVNKTNARNARR